MRKLGLAYPATIKRLSKLLKRGTISQETLNRAMAQTDKDFAAAKSRLLRESTTWRDGAAGTRRYCRRSRQLGDGGRAKHQVGV